MKERLQKIIARAGICSRRKAEELIQQGAVTVDGITVTEPGTKADPNENRIMVNGELLIFPEFVYLILHKPRGYLTTLSDPQGRKTVLSLLNPALPRVFPVGRLDYDAEGLVFMTNDGELANRLIHPRYSIERIYKVRIPSVPSEKDLERLRTGLSYEGITYRPCQARIIRRNSRGCLLLLVLKEGKKHEVKLMCQAIGQPVKRLVRESLSFLNLKGLHRGKFRLLTDKEINRLRKIVSL